MAPPWRISLPPGGEPPPLFPVPLNAAPHFAVSSRIDATNCSVDPDLAGKLIARANEDLWSALKEPLVQFIEDWRKNCSLVDLLRFIVLSGRSEFEDIVWEYISTLEDKYQRGPLAVNHHINPRILGDDWRAKISDLEEKNRRSLLYELAYDGGEAGIRMAVENCVRGS